MKNFSHPSIRLFQDRPLPDAAIKTPQLPLPAAPRFEYNDPLESLLRLMLVLCLLISLAFCFHRTSPHSAMVAGAAAAPVSLTAPGPLPRVNQAGSGGRSVVPAGV